jgi:hypothetical protein
MISGLTSVRDAVITELADVGGAISVINQFYNFGGTSAHCSTTAGSTFNDVRDFCDPGENASNSRCLMICIGQVAPTPESAAGT